MTPDTPARDRPLRPPRRGTLTLTVTDADLARGVPESMTRCPVALAAWRVIQTADRLRVYRGTRRRYFLLAEYFCDQVCYRLERRATEWIARWDRRDLVRPATFTASNIQSRGGATT